jgi:hypothetical protein
LRYPEKLTSRPRREGVLSYLEFIGLCRASLCAMHRLSRVSPVSTGRQAARRGSSYGFAPAHLPGNVCGGARRRQ